jgi:hypothetical protein
VAVSSLGPDWVATRTERDDTTATWTSADGLTWTQVGSIPMRNMNLASAGLLEEVGDELISSPGAGTYFEGTPGVFSSTDGASWSAEDMGEDAWLGELAIGEFTSTFGIWIRASD